MGNKKTVLIVDDHTFIREGLKTVIGRIIGTDFTYEVVGEADNGIEALKKAKSLRPDICLMDISLPDQSGIELTREIKKILPETKVLILSMHSKIDYISEALQAGASGYMIKDSSTDKIGHAIDSISAGVCYLDDAIQTQIVHHIKGFTEKNKRIADEDYGTLTTREQEVMRMLAEGKSTEEIGEKLFISPKTVKNHRFSIMSKLNLHNQHELVRYAVKIGLVDVDLWS